MAVKERLKEFIKYKNISIREFCRIIEVSNSFVTSMKNSMQPSKVTQISLHFPELNTSWLILGEGSMLREGSEVNIENTDNSSIANRNKRFIDAYEFLVNNRIVRNKTDFARKIGKAPQVVYDYFSGKLKVTETIAILLESIFGINKEYILAGKGKIYLHEIASMVSTTSFVADYLSSNEDNPNIRFGLLMDILKEKGFTLTSIANTLEVSTSLITEVKKGRSGVSDKLVLGLTKEFGVNAKWLKKGLGAIFEAEPATLFISNAKIITNIETIEIPFIPIHARASFAESLQGYYSHCEKMVITKLPGYEYQHSMVIEVNGDSMEPTLISGERVFCEFVPPDAWPYTSGLVVVCFGNFVVIKRIHENHLVKNELTLYSDNPQGGSLKLAHEDQEIRQMYRVRYTVYKPLL